MPIDFDGPNLIITLASGETDVTVSELYSRWKDWVKLADNSKFLPAFRVVGGDPLGGGLQAGINVFLRNDLGWRIKPPEEDIIIRLRGNLYAEDPDTPAFIPTVGGFDTLVRLDLSANLLQIPTGEVDPTSLANAVWNRPLTTGGAGTHGERLRNVDSVVAPAVWQQPDSTGGEGTMGAWVRRLLTVARYLGLR
jgi:hypothetical protein